MGLDRSVVTNTINFSYLLFQNSILVMLFKHFCHPNPGSSLLKTKPNISILSGLSKSKAWKSPVLGLAPSPVFSSLPWPVTFPLILLSKSSVAYVVIKKKEKKNYICYRNLASNAWTSRSSSQWLDGFVILILYTCMIYLRWGTAGAWSGTCSLFTRSHSEGKQIFGVFFLYVDIHGGIRQAGIINYFLGEQSINKCCDALPMMV